MSITSGSLKIIHKCKILSEDIKKKQIIYAIMQKALHSSIS